MVNPVFLVMVAMVCRNTPADTKLAIEQFETKLRAEAFVSNAAKNNPVDEFEERARVVFGVNCERTQTAAALQEEFGAVPKFPENAFGFTWCHAEGLKYIFPQKDEHTEDCLEQAPPNPQVPMCGVRETIKNSLLSQEAIGVLARKGTVYIVTMDADAQDFRSPDLRQDLEEPDTRVGILTQFDDIIQRSPKLPRMVSCGFRVNPNQFGTGPKSLPTTKLAVELDMRVRQEIASVVAYAVYFPEPASAFLLPVEDEALQKFSFFAADFDTTLTVAHKDGGKESLQLRRNIQTLTDDGYPSETVPGVFDYKHKGLITSIPERWRNVPNKDLVPERTRGIETRPVEEIIKELMTFSMLDIKPIARGVTVLRPFGGDAMPVGILFALYDPISHIFGSETNQNALVAEKGLFAVVGASSVESLLTDDELKLVEDKKEALKKNLQRRFSPTQPLFKPGDNKSKWIERVSEALHNLAKSCGDVILNFLKEELIRHCTGSIEFHPERSALLDELEEEPVRLIKRARAFHHARHHVAHHAKPSKRKN